MTAQRTKVKVQNQINRQLEHPLQTSAGKKEKPDNFYLKMSDAAINMAMLVFGGVLLGRIFEDVDDPLLLYWLGIGGFAALMIFAYILFKIGNEIKYK